MPALVVIPPARQARWDRRRGLAGRSLAGRSRALHWLTARRVLTGGGHEEYGPLGGPRWPAVTPARLSRLLRVGMPGIFGITAGDVGPLSGRSAVRLPDVMFVSENQVLGVGVGSAQPRTPPTRAAWITCCGSGRWVTCRAHPGWCGSSSWIRCTGRTP